MTVRPVRALFVNENIGGHATVHQHLRRIADERTDVEVRIVNVPPPGFWRKVAAAPLPWLAGLDADLRPVRYQLAQSAAVAKALPNWLVDDSGRTVDVVHLYTHNVGLLARSALRGIPYVVTIDSTNTQSNLMHPARTPTRFSSMSTPVVRPFERAVYQNARRVVANSQWCGRSVIESYGLPEDRVEILPMGVPVPPLPDVIEPAGSATGGRSRLPRVVFIGRAMERKGGNDLVRVHQQWLAERCELVLITQDPVPPGRNMTVINDIRPGDGRVDDILAGSDLFVLPSRIDQWPNAVMEAMASSVPPIVSDVGGMPEMVSHGRAGVVLPDFTPEALRTAIAGLLDDGDRRIELGRAARVRVEQDFDVARTANRLLDIVRDAGRATSPVPGRPGIDTLIR